jgi:hypothetical protein
MAYINFLSTINFLPAIYLRPASIQLLLSTCSASGTLPASSSCPVYGPGPASSSHSGYGFGLPPAHHPPLARHPAIKVSTVKAGGCCQGGFRILLSRQVSSRW